MSVDVAGPTIPATTCLDCRRVFVPVRTRCPHCRSDRTEDRLVGPRGKLYSHSTVHVGVDLPYVIGYVDLDEGPRLFGRVEKSVAAAGCGSRVRLRYVEPARPPHQAARYSFVVDTGSVQ